MSLAVAATACLLLAGCGGSDGGAGARDSSTDAATSSTAETTPPPRLPPRLAAVEAAFARVGQRLEDAGYAVRESTESSVPGVFDELSVGGRGLHRGSGKGLRVLFFPSRATARAWAKSRRTSAHLRVATRGTRVYSLARARALRPSEVRAFRRAVATAERRRR